jgi:protein O-mannosyl-transferase
MRLARAACPYAGILALTVLAYLPLWRNDFIDYDDPHYLTDNPQVLGGFTAEGLCWAWTNNETPYLQPVSWLSLQLDAELFATPGSDGKPFLPATAVHGHSLLWHASNSLLLFLLCRRLTGAPGRSFLVAALFAVHPMHVESVAWATERKDVLSVFFGLVALWAYTCYAERPGVGRYLVVFLALLLSLLSKPMLITLPFVLLLLDFWPLRRWGGAAGRQDARSPRRLVLEKVPLFLLAAMIALLTLESRARRGTAVSFFDLSLWDRLANALMAYGSYLSSTLWPTHLALLYPHPRGNWALLPVLAGAAVLLAVTLLTRRQATRRPWLLVGWLWFVGALVPVIGLAQGGRQAWADRFSYFPHIGLFLALVWGVAELAGRLRLRAPIRASAGALVLGCLVGLTQDQLGHWRNSVTIWQRVVAVTEDNDYAHEHLARAYFLQGQREEGHFHIRAAVRIQRRRLGKRPFLAASPGSLPPSGLPGSPKKPPAHDTPTYNNLPPLPALD